MGVGMHSARSTKLTTSMYSSYVGTRKPEEALSRQQKRIAEYKARQEAKDIEKHKKEVSAEAYRIARLPSTYRKTYGQRGRKPKV